MRDEISNPSWLTARSRNGRTVTFADRSCAGFGSVVFPIDIEANAAFAGRELRFVRGKKCPQANAQPTRFVREGGDRILGDLALVLDLSLPHPNLALLSGSLRLACPFPVFHHLSNIVFAWTTPAS